MLPNQFDADVEMQYKMRRAHRDAERFHLARQAGEPGASSRWQARLRAFVEAGAARLARGRAALRRGNRPVVQDQAARTTLTSGAARGSRPKME